MKYITLSFGYDEVYHILTNDEFYNFYKSIHKEDIKKRIYDHMHANIFDVELHDEL